MPEFTCAIGPFSVAQDRRPRAEARVMVAEGDKLCLAKFGGKNDPTNPSSYATVHFCAAV